MPVVVACPELLEPASHALPFLLELLFPLAVARIPLLLAVLFLRNLKGMSVLFFLAQKGLAEYLFDHFLFGPASLGDHVLEYAFEVALEQCLFEPQLALAEEEEAVVQLKALL